MRKVIPLVAFLPTLVSTACLRPPGETRETGGTGSPEGCVYYSDADGDGYGAEDAPLEADCDAVPTGYSDEAGDCDDSRSDIHPGADETCDGLDDDCDGEVDEDPVDGDPWYPDDDGDGYGDADTEVLLCEEASGYVEDDTDCDDTDADVHPGAEELCNGIDDDCDPSTDEDADEDGDGYSLCDGDCDDDDDTVHPEAAELCDDVDHNCDGDTDDDCVSCTTTVARGDSIQTAIDNAAEGDVICVDPGTHYANLEFDGKNVELVGWDGRGRTVIEADDPGSPVITYGSGETEDSLLQGFTIAGADVSGYGGGIRIKGTSPRLRELEVTRNSSQQEGGGISINAGSPVLEDIQVHDNYAGTHGGGIRVYGAEVTIEGLEAWDNEANRDSTGRTGGGLTVQESTVTVRDATFYENSSAYGGAFSVRDSTGVTLLSLENAAIYDNEGASRGGGGYASQGTVEFLNVNFSGNRASSGTGGALYLVGDTSGGTAIVVTGENVIFAGNTSSANGGAIVLYRADAVLYHALFHGNEGAGGGAIYASVYTDLELVHSIVQSNVAEEGCGHIETDSGSDIVVTFSAFYDNLPDDGDSCAEIVGDDGNLFEDALFLDSGAEDPYRRNFHLDEGSPLRDAGQSDYVDPDGTAPDFGAYGGEAGGSWDLDRDGYFEWWQPGEYIDDYVGENWDCDDRDPDVYPGSGC